MLATSIWNKIVKNIIYNRIDFKNGNIHNSFIHSITKLKTTQIFINKRKGQYVVACLYIIKLFSNKTEHVTNTCNKANEF